MRVSKWTKIIRSKLTNWAPILKPSSSKTPPWKDFRIPIRAGPILCSGLGQLNSKSKRINLIGLNLKRRRPWNFLWNNKRISFIGHQIERKIQREWIKLATRFQCLNLTPKIRRLQILPWFQVSSTEKTVNLSKEPEPITCHKRILKKPHQL